ncbi:cell division control protein 48 homolog C-like isoform X2 [Salvia hispanica]|uniref:cell division control protein 48 homolog C-like isoform X2 n=1 Tax=Salvia hispanica TaxID=49212 RepID=UPI0020090940|nr:cell division control protein 48 homolog C-like isoform X2 [Salvia hispanica]
MPTSHRETPLSGEEASMSEEIGSVARALQACDDQIQCCSVDTAAASGAKNPSDSQNLQLSVDEPAAKRQKHDEIQSPNRQIEVARASASAIHSDSNVKELDSARDHKSGGDMGEKDANGGNVAIIGELEQGNELGDSKREVKKTENKWPMFSDIGGLSYTLNCLKEEVIAPMLQLKLLRHFGGKPMTSILLHGPPGCGKTMLARAIGNEARVPFYEISAVTLNSGVSGILELFSRAYMNAPSIVFIDEIDALTSKTESLLQCPLKQLMTCMKEPVNDGSEIERSNSGPGGYVLTIGATNKPNALDLALRKQFDREFFLDVPKTNERHDILSVLTRNHKFEVGFDLLELGRWTQGFVARDLAQLVNEACMIALNGAIRSRAYKKKFNDGYEAYGNPFSDEELEGLRLTMSNFHAAISMACPSAEMEEFSKTSSTNWNDVGGLQLLKLEFERRVVKHIKFPQVYEPAENHWDYKLGESLREIGVKDFPTSFFLYGPHGCGKTLIVEALAKEAGANFLHIKGSELSKFGELSTMMVEHIFKYAKLRPPCIVFFDELDIFNPDDFTEEDLEEDITEWQSVEYKEIWSQTFDIKKGSHVYVIVSSSRVEVLDRISFIKSDFDRIFYAPLPTPEERGEILKALALHKPVDVKVDLVALGNHHACHNFSGADLFTLVTIASLFAIQRPSLSCGGSMTITSSDFNKALHKVPLSHSDEKWAQHVID